MKHTAYELLTQKNAKNTAEIIICPAGMKQILNWLNNLQVWLPRDKATDSSLLVETSQLHFLGKGINA